MPTVQAPPQSIIRPSRTGHGRNLVGGFFLVLGGVHLGLASAAWSLPTQAMLGRLAARDLRTSEEPS